MPRPMTSRERLLAAARSQDVDYVPMVINFVDSPRPARANWRDERERLATFRQWGWDTYVSLGPVVRPSESVRVEISYEGDAAEPILCQTFHTPAGTVRERLRVTEDWPEAKKASSYFPIGGDFHSPRFLEVPFKEAADLDTLEYLFPLDSPRDVEAMTRAYQEKRALADEFGVALLGGDSGGMDWLTWLHPAEQAVLLVMDEPEFVKRLISRIDAAFQRRIAVMLDLGVDGIVRRGWYESADLWSPSIFREYARPAVEAHTATVHRAGAVSVYLMDSGVTPLLPDLAPMHFDCLLGADPALGLDEGDLGQLRRALPGKALWGGISGPEHLMLGSSERTERAVERAFADLGRAGFILGPSVVFRHYYSWDNMDACERAWKRLRSSR